MTVPAGSDSEARLEGEGKDELLGDLSYVKMEIEMLQALRDVVPFDERPPLRRSIRDTLQRMDAAQSECLSDLLSDDQQEPEDAKPASFGWHEDPEAWNPGLSDETPSDDIFKTFLSVRQQLLTWLSDQPEPLQERQHAVLVMLNAFDMAELESLKHLLFDVRTESMQQRLFKESHPSSPTH